ncbi:MAG: fused MFS/spermidine synthase [Candidatus Adiutrix sp.]|jgi:spermidine synthase|nr:fused MFS/spermidine synthase [Candidatus Adiutrix sp.]
MSRQFLKNLAAGFKGLLPDPGDQPAIVFEGDSPFHHIIIRDEGHHRTMYFSGPEGEEAETSIDLGDPGRSVFEYPGLMLTALALAPGQHILLLGLGGGFLPGLFARFLPERELTVVEVDPLVAELAGTYFGFTPGPNVRLVLADGRDFLSGQAPATFDQIWLDAFSGDYVPTGLSGLTFLELCRDRLTPGGLLAQNFHQSRPAAFQNQLKTTEAAFGPFLALGGRRCGNAVVLARRPKEPGERPAWKPAELMAAMKKFGPRLGPFDLTTEIRKAKTFRIDPEARVIP